MRTQREIFNQIANSIIDVLPQGEKFNYACLEIKRLSANVGFSGYYMTSEDEKKWLDIFNLNLDTSCIEELYQITQNQPPHHKNWNRAIYMLFPSGKIEIEYIWDEDLQNAVDRLNDKKQN